MNANLDPKQKRIILSWLEQSRKLDHDPYASFIALWISFNAYCYALYAKTANRRRADLRKETGLSNITSTPSKVEGKLRLDVERFRLEIDEPGKISIVISARYTEDNIFSEFAKHYQTHYNELLKEMKFREAVVQFHSALAKNGKHYVINMALGNEYDSEGSYKSMVSKNIIVPLDKYDDLKQMKDALYQVRCNVFHGEKVPGHNNDDRIVKSAYPVLLRIMESITAHFQDNYSY